MATSLYIGLMSGTSLDGVDGVLTAIPDNYSGGSLSIIATTHLPFAQNLRQELMALQTSGENEIERSALTANDLARLYAECVHQLLKEAQISSNAISAIGVHGQTIRHRPERGFTTQINNPALLAELTQINVIADFRSRDIAANGQGAPLVPAFHRTVFGSKNETRVIVNIGGIANISVLNPDSTSGFDTGPGNLLMDAWIAKHKGHAYDENGAWAASGQASMALLDSLLAEPFFALPPPKSTGRDLFHLNWLTRILESTPSLASLSPGDVQATLAVFTATSIENAIRDYAPSTRAVYICGGGAKNTYLMRHLKNGLQAPLNIEQVETTDALGIASQHVEALAFAWLAYRFQQRHPGNLPEVTGATGLRILGALYPG